MTQIWLDHVMQAGGDVFALMALAGVAYLAAGVFAIRRPSRARGRPVTSGEPVSVLVPLCGAEKGLGRRLAALCRQDYPAPIQLICGVCSSHDPAVAVVRAAARAFPHYRIDLVIDGREHGSNRKVSNLKNMLEAAEHDTLVMLDSDIEVQPDYLTHVVDDLQQANVGAVTCLYHGVPGEGLWSQLSAMSINVQFLTNVLSGVRLGMAAPCFGATIAIRRPLLDELGGLARFADRLYDDYALGQAVRATGLQVAISSAAVGHVCLERSARDYVESQLRWARTIRVIDPLGNAGLVVSHAFALAVLALLLGQPNGLALVIAAGAVRVIQCLSVERAFRLPHQPYAALPARELLSFGIYVAALLRGPVVWRGRRYELLDGGAIRPADQAPVSRSAAQPSTAIERGGSFG